VANKTSPCHIFLKGDLKMSNVVSNVALFAPLILLMVVGLFFLIVALLQWLWNITIPEVFGLKSITYWQAFRLLIIAAILFGGGGMVLFN
jgi:hypothetical protein